MAYTHRLFSPQEFSHMVFGGVYMTILKNNWRRITSRSYEVIDQGECCETLVNDQLTYM
jgi:hypothetical protein